MHVGIYKSWCKIGTTDINNFFCFSVTPPRDNTIGNSEIGFHPFTGCRRQNKTASKKDVGRLIAACNRESPE
jgi:hypothetical protein